MGYVGASVPGVLNSRLAAGKGTFVDDIRLPGMAHAAILRSPHAHARIRSINTRAAEQLPGVVCVGSNRCVITPEHGPELDLVADRRECGASAPSLSRLLSEDRPCDGQRESESRQHQT